MSPDAKVRAMRRLRTTRVRRRGVDHAARRKHQGRFCNVASSIGLLQGFYLPLDVRPLLDRVAQLARVSSFGSRESWSIRRVSQLSTSPCSSVMRCCMPLTRTSDCMESCSAAEGEIDRCQGCKAANGLGIAGCSEGE